MFSIVLTETHGDGSVESKEPGAITSYDVICAGLESGWEGLREGAS